MAQVKLPPLSVVTLDVHGVRFVRLAHVVTWLEEVLTELENDPALESGPRAELVTAIAEEVAGTGEVE